MLFSQSFLIFNSMFNLVYAIHYPNVLCYFEVKFLSILKHYLCEYDASTTLIGSKGPSKISLGSCFRWFWQFVFIMWVYTVGLFFDHYFWDLYTVKRLKTSYVLAYIPLLVHCDQCTWLLIRDRFIHDANSFLCMCTCCSGLSFFS